MNIANLLRPLTSLRQGGTPSGKALHKPVLLLALMEEIEHNPDKIEAMPIDMPLKQRFDSIWRLLIPDQKPGDFFKPVFHLPNEGFWEVRDARAQQVVKEYNSLKGAAADGLRGCFTGDLGVFLKDPEGREIARMVLLDHYFPDTRQRYWEVYGQASQILEIESEIVLREPEPRYVRRISLKHYEGFVRYHKFREHVLRIYNHTCCMSGWRAAFQSNYPLLDAAHIEQHAVSGINHPSNGLALCKNLHAAFDNGLISLSDDHRILVNRGLIENNTAYSLTALAGKKILLPSDTRFHPAPERLQWHRDRWGMV